MNSVFYVSNAPSFKSVINWETQVKGVQKKGEITATPDMDREMKSHLRNLGIRSNSHKLCSARVNSNNSDFRKLIDAMNLDGFVIPDNADCQIQEVRPVATPGKTTPKCRNVQIFISRLTKLFIDFAKANEGIVTRSELRQGIRP